MNINNEIKLPSNEWLEQTNKKLENMPASGRPVEVWRLWQRETGQYTTFGTFGGSTLLKHIEEWFNKNTKYSQYLQQPLRHSVYFFDGDFWEVNIPIVFGTSRINLEKTIKAPTPIIDRIRDDDEAAYTEHFEAACDFFLLFDELSIQQKDSKVQQEGFIASINRHLLSATSLLLERKPNGKAIEDCRHVIELSLKSILISNGITKEDLKREYSHNLEKIFKKVLEVLAIVDIPISEGDIKKLPEIEARYCEINVDYITLWDVFKLSQRLATFCLQYVTTKNNT